MNVDMKKIMKFAGATCAATGVVALSALVASGAAVGAIVEGFKGAASTMKKILAEGEVEPEKMPLDEGGQTEEYVVVSAENQAESSGIEEVITECDAENNENSVN